jgi:hypothetical protein
MVKVTLEVPEELLADVYIAVGRVLREDQLLQDVDGTNTASVDPGSRPDDIAPDAGSRS